MSNATVNALFKDGKISVITFATNDAAFAIPLDQVLYIEKDVKRNIKLGELEVKVGISAVDVAGARRNLDAEVRAWSLARGELRWKRNLSRDPRIGQSSRVYGAVTAAGGRLFVATHNLEGPSTGQPAFVACLGDDDATSNESEGLVVDREKRRSYLPSASPVSPWAWALGNAAGSAIAIFILAVSLYTAAGIGATIRGGVDTNRGTSMGKDGTVMLAGGPRPTRRSQE